MAQKPFKAQTSVITCDMQGIVQEYAADAGELFGWSPAEVIGKLSVATFHLPENVPTLVPRLLKEAVENAKFEEEVTLRRKDAEASRASLGRAAGKVNARRRSSSCGRPAPRFARGSPCDRSFGTGNMSATWAWPFR